MPKMDAILSSKSLHYFLQLIDTMNYTQAAQILGITQPALTQQIKKIEHAIGTPLFGQMGKKLYLTEAGKQLQVGAIKLLGTMNSVVSDIQEFTQADRGNIAIGVLESVNCEWLQRFLIKFNQKYPDITINLSCFNRKDLWYNLDNNLIDLAILYIPDVAKKSQASLNNQYEQMKINDERLIILTHLANLEAGEAYPISTFTKQKWVAYPDGFFLTQLMKEKFESRVNIKKKLDISMSFSSTEQLVATAIATNYDTFVSHSYYQAHKNDINLTPVFLKDDKKFLTSIVYRKGKKDVPRVANILAEFKQFLPK
ncbi:LysR family transcriptional regulator [Lactobacillus sp. ESL0233]|uniref:LysR substrate-binding domain-containing protein n=1 Tax=Lactobacillus sp. ESL0233 TaxID=2069354 RepID=UPI000EFA87A5|nr:LysR family transcriptional regulator [Lactobacillus sp. ESL0233]RMC41422.1 LysR family transcriptional regulator [Lactobacillus sp. ESL0233]